MILDAVRDHYISLWGPPSWTATFRTHGPEAEVYKWDASNHPEGVNMYATIAASAYPVSSIPEMHRMEFYIGLLPAADDVASPLAALGLYSALHG